jgi:zinc protease
VNSEKLEKYLPFVFLLLFTVHCLLPADAFALSAKKTVLQNGLVVLHSEEHSLPILMLTLLIKAGPLNEPREKAGLANLTAELLTEGTKHRKSTEISEEIEFIGASLDISTSSDYIAISLSILKKDIEKGFDLFSDVLLNPVFPQQEIDRKKVLLKGSLKRNEEDPSFVAERAFRKEVFGDHPYGRLVEGSDETIDNIKREDIIKFFSDYFLPNNSILSVVGDLTQEELNVLVKRYLDSWIKADLPPTAPKVPIEKKSKKVIKVDKDLTQANIILGHLGICRDDPDYYAVSVMNYILGGGGFSSRLMQSIRDEMGLAYDVNSSFSMNKEKGIFQIEVQTKNESAGLVISEILKQMEKIRKETVSDEELSDAKSYLTGSFTRMLDTNRKIANFLALVEFYSLGLDYIGRYPGYINSVTKEDIRRVAKEYLHPDNCVLVIVADLKKTDLEIPPKE